MVETEDEDARPAAVESYELVGSSRLLVLDSVAQVAAALFDVPIASVSLMHRHVQWFSGLTGLDKPGISRIGSFSGRLISDPRPLVVSDTRHDLRYRNFAHLARTPPIRFYAGIPLIDDDGYVLGAVAVLDRQPRQVSLRQRRTLETLTVQAAAHLRAVRDAHRVSSMYAELERRRDKETEAIASISHELRTPLAAMLGFVELILEQPDLALHHGLFEPIKQNALYLVEKSEQIVARPARQVEPPRRVVTS